MNTSDIIIIGAGPGGYETAVEAVHMGLSVTLIERGSLGGTCLNRGCIPTKCLCRSAEVARTVAGASAYGVDVSGVSFDYAAAVARMRSVVSTLREGIATLLKGVNLVQGTARFISSSEVEVEDDGKVIGRYTAPRIIIATGSAPSVLPVEGAGLAIDSDAVLAMDILPASAVIIGGGVIGMEFACILHAFGVQVTVVEYCKEILPSFDRDIAKRMHSILGRGGIDIITSSPVRSIVRDVDGVSVIYDGRKGSAAVSASVAVMAVGRRPVLPDGLEAAGIMADRRGIVTDSGFRTTAPGVYAIGDVNGRCMLAHAASAQGRVVLGLDVGLDVIPAAVFTFPEAAMVGLTEEQCRAEGMELSIGKSMFGANGKALAMGEGQGMVKLVAEKATGKILGCHILGPHASDLVQEVALAMSSGLTVRSLASAVHAHPTLTEAVAEAARAIL